MTLCQSGGDFEQVLTSGGITNDTLAYELEGLAGKPFQELKIGFIPSAAFGDPSANKSWLIDDLYRLRVRGATVAVLSLADLTPEEIADQLAPVDVVFVGGGQTFYLSYLFQQKGMFELLPKLLETKVYASISAGSMIMTPSLRSVSFALRQMDLSDEGLEQLGPKGRSLARTCGFVDFLIRPHWNGEAKFADITPEIVQKAADQTGHDVYMLDNESAVLVNGREVRVVGEGRHLLLRPGGGVHESELGRISQ